MQPRSDSETESLIKEWLFRFGVNFEKDVAPYVPLWMEAFGAMNPEVLLRLFQRAMKSCRFWPTVAEILAPLEMAEEGSYEDEWQALLEYCEKWVNRDVPNMRGKPQLPADIDHAARAAGGLYYLESCSVGDLVWAKKRFTEDLERQRKTGNIASFPPGSELRELMAAAAPRFELSPAAAEYFGNPPDACAPRPVLQERASTDPRPTRRRRAEICSEVSNMISQGEASYKKQSEKISAEWLAAHGVDLATETRDEMVSVPKTPTRRHPQLARRYLVNT
jgi:hypothetical protein